MRDFLAEAFGYVELDWRDNGRIDPRYDRPTEVDSLLADASKAKTALGVTPPGQGLRMLGERFGGWHRWESQVVSMEMG